MKHCLFILLASVLVAVPVGAAEPELKGSPAELSAYLSTVPKMVRISGEGESKAVADRAIVSLKVSFEHKQLQDALRGNEEVRGRIAAYLKEQGLGPDRVQAARFASTQKPALFSEKAKSHRVESFLKVTVRDDKEFQAVSGSVDRFPEVQFLGIDFEHSSVETLKLKATTAAIENAGVRRKIFEDQLRLKLVPCGFSESVAPVPRIASIELQGGSPSSSFKSPYAPSRGDAASGEAASVFGELVYRAQVSIEYSVEGR